MDDKLEIDTKPDPPDLTPLIDVIFILIVFFLLTSTIQDKILEIDLPDSTESSNEQINNELVIEIDKTNTYFINGKQADFKEVVREVESEARKKSPVITVRSDRETDFGAVIKILDLVKKNSIKGVNFSVEAESISE